LLKKDVDVQIYGYANVQIGDNVDVAGVKNQYFFVFHLLGVAGTNTIN